ncbi:NAD(P)-dependent oxidoreductase [Ramlibacter alkalitolerans]|uniref:NAD(P)-dependent oxidoreductase n=1 Tax=Ramlibacter alkalitolerans TaxID=2039631 RepID=A0ABS1JRT1_9BURK|nr:NAD(P)-dependent oxidoreductase [Ramlibacter alkalitolerans]
MKNSRNGKAAAGTAVGVVGLGIMGSAMSANLLKAGFAVFGSDPVARARRKLADAGGTAFASATEVAHEARFIVLSLPSEAALEAVCGELIASSTKRLVVAETSTLPESAKRRAHDLLAEHGITLLDCPLSGTGAQAVNRDLAVYASGEAAAIKAFAPVFEGFARARYDVGAFGNGTRMKLVANLLVAIHNVSTAEAILMGARAGLDPAQIVEVVADGAGGSRMFQVRGPVMVDRSWDKATMKVSTWQKDMRLINELLQGTATPAPLFAACLPVYNAAMALGHGDADTAAVFAVLEQMVGGAPATGRKRARS